MKNTTIDIKIKTFFDKSLKLLFSLAVIISQLSLNTVKISALADNNVFISTSPNSTLYQGSTVTVDSSVDVNLKDNTIHSSGLIYSASVVISNYVSGDVLSISGQSTTVVSSTYSLGTLSIFGRYTEAQIEDIFRHVQFTPSNTSNSDVSTRTITFNLSTGNVYNSHYYELINNGYSILYSSAKSDSSNKKFFGLQGYLIVPDTSSEMSAVTTIVNDTKNSTTLFPSFPNYYWLGLYRNDSTYLKKDSGPNLNTYTVSEYGSAFPWNGGSGGEEAAYSNTEPYVASILSAGLWADVSYNNGSINGYVVEYGGMSVNENPVISASKSIDFASYSINYVDNGATSGTAPSTQPYRVNSTVSIASNSGSLQKSGYTFIGWNTSADGTGILYQSTQNITLSSSLTLYAHWIKANINSSSLIYSRGSGEQAVDSDLELSGLKIKQVLIKISSGYQSGDALTVVSSDLPSDVSLKSISALPGTYLLYSDTYKEGTVFQQILRNLKFSTSSSVVGTRTIQIIYSNNEHGYGFKSPSSTWAVAKTNAETSTLSSKSGYLATLTTQNENTVVDILGARASVSRWIGLNYSAGWKWMTGPETGQSVTTSGFYTQWVSGQPDSGGTYPGSFWFNMGGWDDLNGSVEYVIEYGDLSVSWATLQRDVVVSNIAITYQSSGQTSGTVPTDSTNYTYNQSVTVKNQNTLARTGYTFSGWTDGSTSYSVNSTFNITSNKTLTAVWTANPLTITYYANNGSGTSTTQNTSAYSSVTLTSNTFTRTGYQFRGWNTLANGTGTAYTNAQVLTMGAVSLSLYAQWDRYITFAIPTFTSTYRYVTDLLVYSGTPGASTLVESEGRLRINPALNSQTGGVFFGQKLILPSDKSFSSHFSFKITDGSSSADGFVYILSSNQASTSSTGGGLGYGGMNNSVAIVFDTYYNAGDPNPNSINLSVNGNMTSYLTSYANIPDVGFLNVTRYVWVNYDGTNFKVYYGSTDVFSDALLVINKAINLSTYLTTDDIYVGFTGATGGATQDNSIYSWYFDSRYETIELSNSVSLSSDFTTITMSDPGEISSTADVTVTLKYPDGTPRANEAVSISVDGVGSVQSATTDTYGQATFTISNPNTFSTLTTKTVIISTSSTSSTESLKFKAYTTLSLNANGGTGTSTSLSAYLNGSVTLPGASTYSKTGYTLSSWNTLATGLGTSYAFNSSYSLSSASPTLYAIYTLNTYTITYSLDGSTNSGSNPSSYTYTTPTITLASPSKTGYVFNGWYTDSDFSGSAVTSIPLNSTGNKTFYAKLTRANYNLSFDSNGGSSVSDKITPYQNAWEAPTDPTKVGYTFAGWFVDDQLFTTAFSFSTTATENKTVYAKWTLLPIEYISGTQSSLAYSNSAITIDSGVTVDLNGDDRGFTSATVSISSGFSSGDVLSYSDASNTFATDPVPSYNAATGVLTISGSYTEAQWQAIFRDVKFSTNSTSTTTRTITYKLNQTMSSLVINGKSHYYELISVSGSTWVDAYNASESKTLYGLKGYLATSTSITENDKLTTLASSKNIIWISASDSQTEGSWKWMGGPEMGTLFWTGETNGSGTGFNNWHSGYQPTLAGGDYAYLVTSGIYTKLWGVIDNTFTGTLGYVVEYGGYDADVTHITSTSRDITFSSASISFNANGSTSGSVPTVSDQRQYTTITLPTNSGNLVKTGYTFSGWNTLANGTGTDYALGATYTLSSSSQTLYAKWSVNSYSVSFNSNSGSSVSSQSINYNAKATEPTVPTRTGYSFVGWYKESSLTNAFDFTTDVITADQTLYAKWNLNTYSLSYVLNGGTNSGSNPSTYTYTTSAITFASATKDYYRFDGWYLDSGFTQAITQLATLSTENKTLYAKFTPLSYTISYTLNGGSATTVSSYTIESAEIVLPSPTKVGYTFSRWEDSSGNTVTSIPTGSHVNLSFTAIFTINSYALSFNSNGGSSVTTQNVNYNSTASLPSAPTKTGYTFGGWYHDSNLTLAFDFNSDRITSAKTLYASWSINEYTLSFDSNGGSSVGSQTKNYQQTFSLPTSPTQSGYSFVGWYTDDSSFLNSYDFSSLVTQNLTLHAKWYIEVSYDMNYPNLTAPSVSLVDYGQSYTSLKSVGNVRPGYTLLGWFTSASLGTKVTTSTTVSTSVPHTLYAQWGLNVLLDKQDGTSLVNYGSVKYGSTYEGYDVSALSLPSPTKTGYVFNGWYTQASGGTQITSTSTVTQKDHHTLYAHWTAKTPTVSLDLTNGGDLGSNASSFTATYDGLYGSSLVTPTRTTTGTYFTGWWTAQSGGTRVTSTDTVLTETNHTLYAQWGIHDSYSTSYNGNGNTSGTAPASQSQFTDETTTISGYGSLAKTGYSFNGWNTLANGSGDNFAISDVIDTEDKVDRTLYAKWTPNSYTVTLNKNDGTSTSQTITVTYDSTYSTLSNPFTRTGYTFSKWLNSNLQEVTSSTNVQTASNHTLDAQWSPNTYIVTYYASGGTFVTRPAWFNAPTQPAGEDVSTSATAIYSRYYGGTPTVTKTGYDFVEWNSASNRSGSTVTGSSIVSTASNHSYYAIWAASTDTPYSINYYQQKVEGTGYRLVDSVVLTGTTDSTITLSPNAYTGFSRFTSDLSLTILPDGSSSKDIYYNRQSKTISYDSNGGSSVADEILLYQQVATEPISPTRSGYTFGGWYTDDITFANRYDFSSAVTQDTPLHAKWNLNTYSINYGLNGGSASTLNSYSVTSSTYTLPTPSKSGYSFVSWHTQSNLSLASVITEIPSGSTGNIDLYAKYTPITYSLAYTLNGGSATTVSSYTIESNSITLPTPTKSGYSFEGWFEHPDFTGTGITEVSHGSIGNKHFYAKWSTDSYSIIYHLNGGSATTVSSYTIETPTITLPTPIKNGYTFTRWENANASTVSQIPNGSMGDQEFTAIYTPISYSISYSLNGGSATTVSSYTIESSTLSLPNPTKVGYTFSHWEDYQGNTVSAIATGSVGNKQFIALYTIDSYPVHFNTNGGSSISDVAVDYNNHVNQPSVPTKNGYLFEGWYEDASLTQDFDFAQSRITGPKTLYANYDVVTYSLSYSLDGGTATNPSSYTVVDPSITLLSPHKTGYAFEGWFDNANFTGTAITHITNGSYGNKTLYAKYGNAMYDIQFETNGGSGIVDETYIFGETLPTLPSPKREGYTFEGWFDDVNLTQSFATTIMPSRTFKLYAKWSLNRYSISYVTSGGTHANPTLYSILDEVNLGAASKAGYVFESWVLNGMDITSIPKGSTGDLTLNARFRLAQRTARFGSFNTTQLGSDSATFAFSLADQGNPSYTSFNYELSEESMGVVQSGTVSGTQFSVTGLAAYTTYTLRLFASNGMNTIETSISFEPRLLDSDNDGVPDIRDAYPKDPSKTYDSTKLNPELVPVRALVADENSNNDISIRIDPKDLMGTSSLDTILLVMGSTQFVIPVAILDTMIANSINEETYLTLKVEPQVLNTEIPADLLDSVNMTMVSAYDYLLMQVDSTGKQTQIHELGGKIKIGVDVNTIVGEYDPENLEIYYYDPENGSLQVMLAEYDPINHSMVFMTDHFSYYVVGVKKDNDPTKLTLQLIFLAISLIIAIVYWFKKNFTIVKK